MAATRKTKTSGRKRIKASRVRLRDLDARKGKTTGGGMMGGMSGGGFSGVLKKPR